MNFIEKKPTNGGAQRGWPHSHMGSEDLRAYLQLQPLRQLPRDRF
jgi:hypothetical protein